MHRLLVESGELESGAPRLGRGAANHLRVLRPKDGEAFEAFDGMGGRRECRYSAAEGRLVASGPVVRESEASRLRLTLFACVTKGSRWDWTIEKATELGASRIVPVVSERTIVRIPAAEREAKRERWTRIAEEAARQSDALWIPDILAPVDFDDALALVRETRCFVGAITTPPPRHLFDAIGRAVCPQTAVLDESRRVGRAVCPQTAVMDESRRVEGNAPYQADEHRRVGRAVCPQTAVLDESRRVEGNAPYQGDESRRVEGNAPYQADEHRRVVGNAPYHLAVFVGPEGDFTPEELRRLVEVATPVSLGPTILRAETAAIFALSVVAAAASAAKQDGDSL